MTAKRLFGAVKGYREHIADHTGRLYSDNEVANLLNIVYKENEQLKKEVDMLSCELSVSANKTISKNCRIQELVKENEQLKTQLQNTSDQRDEFHRGARENANRVGKLEKENEQLKKRVSKLQSKYDKNKNR